MTTRSDVVVVGGGVVGLCAAHALQRAGCTVTVLTREPVGEGASAGNAGMIVPSHLVPLAAPGVVAQGLRWLLRPESPFYIRPRLSLELARWLWAFRGYATAAHVARSVPLLRDLSLASVAALEALQEDLGDVGYAGTGLLMTYHTAKGRKDNLALADTAEAAGLAVERLDADAVRRLEPALRTPVAGGVRYAQDGRVDPDRLLRRLAETLRTEGVAIHEGVAVEGFDGVGRQVTAVRAAGAAWPAEAVVLAAGAWTPALARGLGLRLPVQPACGYSLTVLAPSDGPRLPMILTDEKLTVTPLPGRLRFAGTFALAGFAPRADPRRTAALYALARAYAPEALDDAPPPALWRGFRPCTPDGLPVIGRSPRHDNLLLATGHGMMGVTLAPVTGRLVAQLLTGAAPDVDPAPFAPRRFVRG